MLFVAAPKELRAQEEGFDPYGTHWFEYGNVRISAEIKGLAPPGEFTANMKVSGTNVNFSAGLLSGVRTGGCPPGEPCYTSAKIQSGTYSLKINGEEIGIPPVGEPSENGDHVRFATTHFPDGATITIECKGTYILQGPGLPDYPKSLNAKVDLKAYNKAILLATIEEYDPTGAGYILPGHPSYPDPPLYAGAADRAVAAVTPRITGVMKHTLVPGNGDGKSWRESTAGSPRLDERMCEATLFFGFTHGETTNWRSSQQDQLVYTPLASNEVRTYVTTKPGTPPTGREVPDYNLGVFHACETLSTFSSSLNPKAFLLLPAPWPNPANVFANRAYAGFAGLVHYQLLQPANTTLDKHADVLFGYLAAGERFQSAILKTQGQDFSQPTTAHVPKSINTGTAIYMIMRGDSHARIVKVYLSEQEWIEVGASVRSDWKWVR